MSDHQGVYSHGKNPAITERKRRTNWFLVQRLALGFLLGIAIWAAWDYGLIYTLVFTLREVSAALWAMVQDSAAAWGDFFRFVLESIDS
jgi:hypothetical protein